VKRFTGGGALRLGRADFRARSVNGFTPQTW
jgi:hypothetical protein